MRFVLETKKGKICMSECRIGIFLSYLNIGLHAVIGFLYVPILLHFIGKNEFGLYQLMGSLIAYFSVMDFGLSAAVIRFYAKYRSLKDRVGMENVLALAMWGYAGVDVFILSAGAICYFQMDSLFGASMSPWELEQAKDIFLLLLFNIAITLSTMVFRSVINAHEKFLFLKGMETIQLVLQPVLVVVILMKYPSAFSVALVQTVLNVVLVGFRMYYCFFQLHTRIHFHYWDSILFHEFKTLALSVFAVTLIDQVFFKTNQILLGVISGTAAVAVYSLASTIYMNYMALSTAISGVYLPHVTEMVAKNAPVSSFSDLFIHIGRWQYYLLALVATGFIIFGKQFINIWAGTDFENAYWMTILIILPFTIDLIQNIGLSILQARNQYGFRAKVYLGIGILNLILAVPLGIRYGGIGCAFATGLSMLIGNGFIMNWFYCKKIGLAIFEFWRQILKITIPITFVGVLGYIGNMAIESHSILVFVIKVFVYTAMYVGIIYVFAMNKEEKGKLRKVFRLGE